MTIIRQTTFRGQQYVQIAGKHPELWWPADARSYSDNHSIGVFEIDDFKVEIERRRRMIKEAEKEIAPLVDGLALRRHLKAVAAKGVRQATRLKTSRRTAARRSTGTRTK